MEKIKFYDKTWFFVLMCIILPPIAIVFMFIKKKDFKKVTKIILTIVLAIYTIIGIVMSFNKPPMKEIDISNYITKIEVIGANESASVTSVEIDYAKLQERYSPDLDGISTSNFTYELDENSFIKNGKIENGDTITANVTGTYNNYKFTGKITNKISGLKTQAQIDKEEKAAQEKAEKEQKEAAAKEKAAQEKADKEAAQQTEKDNALLVAQNYIDQMAFSEKGLREQLKYEKFPDYAIDYAVAHVIVNYNEEAEEAANNYMTTVPMSKSALYDQLIYEGFTASQANYGIDHIN